MATLNILREGKEQVCWRSCLWVSLLPSLACVHSPVWVGVIEVQVARL